MLTDSRKRTILVKLATLVRDPSTGKLRDIPGARLDPKTGKLVIRAAGGVPKASKAFSRLEKEFAEIDASRRLAFARRGKVMSALEMGTAPQTLSDKLRGVSRSSGKRTTNLSRVKAALLRKFVTRGKG